MRTNKWILITALAAAAVSLFTLQQGCKKSPETHVVLIVLDTLRADHLPFYGYEKNTAPFLSELASQSIVFGNVFSASSWTAPASASIFTSLYPFQHGVTTGFIASKYLKVELNRIPGEIKTITEVLKENGYKTYGVADNVNICEEEGFTQGFDRFKLFPYKNEKKINRQLEEWVKEIKAQKKYFLYIHYNDCHHPYHPRKPWYKPQKKKRRDLIARYDSEINYVDTKIKKMYELFGWDKNTLLIVTSDHGEEFWEHKGKRHGQTLYSEVIRVPLLIYFPEKDRGHKRIMINVSNMDILPTVRGYLDIESKEVEAGINLMPAIDGNENNMHERYIFSHLFRYSRYHDGKKKFHKATIFKDWKYIFVDEFQKSFRRELYNMREDPREKSNVYKKNETLAKLLFSKFAAFEKNCEKFDQEIKRLKLDKKKMEELKTLGYVK